MPYSVSLFPRPSDGSLKPSLRGGGGGPYHLRVAEPGEESLPAMKVFETPESYIEHNNVIGAHGIPTSSIDWCERNYVVTLLIAEFWNTTSNTALLLAGLFGYINALRQGLEHRIANIFLGVCLIGVGSFAFHATLTHDGQQLDETPMIITTLMWVEALWHMDPKVEQKNPTKTHITRYGLMALGAGWTVAHYVLSFILVFQLFFGVLIVSALLLMYNEYQRCDNERARAIVRIYLVLIILAFSLWLVDQHFCEQLHSLPLGIPNPQFHAVWHVLNGASAYIGPVFVAYRRQCLVKKPGTKVSIEMLGGYVPYVKVTASGAD